MCACLCVCARLLLISAEMRCLSVGMFHLFVCLLFFSMFFHWFFRLFLGFYVDAAAEFRKYNVVVYPTDGQGSTYVPVLFRPTGPFNFFRFISGFFSSIQIFVLSWIMCTSNLIFFLDVVKSFVDWTGRHLWARLSSPPFCPPVHSANGRFF